MGNNINKFGSLQLSLFNVINQENICNLTDYIFLPSTGHKLLAHLDIIEMTIFLPFLPNSKALVQSLVIISNYITSKKKCVAQASQFRIKLHKETETSSRCLHASVLAHRTVLDSSWTKQGASNSQHL